MKTLAQAKWSLHFSILLAVLLLNFSAIASTVISGKVVGVSDGDTITVLQGKQQYKIRLYGVDCPESGQAFGKKAKEFASSMVFGKSVEVTVFDVDRYGRSVGVVHVDGTTVNEALLQNGYAWLYTKYCDQPFCREWNGLQLQASSKRLGLWAEKDQTPPWEWRKNQREGEQKSTTVTDISGGPFHGNTKSSVYHAPGCQHYNCNNCTETFRYSEEAERAGFRKHEQCVKG